MAALTISASAADHDHLPLPEVNLPAEVAIAQDPEAAITELFVSKQLEELVRQAYLDAGYTEAPANQNIKAQADFPDELAELAYSDLEQADEETKAEILQARRQIIYSYDWCADGGLMVVRNGNEFTIPPLFSELFPDWDVPVEEPDTCLADTNDEIAPQDDASISSDTIYIFNSGYYIPANNPNKIAPNFFTTDTIKGSFINAFSTWASTIPANMAHYNIGFTDPSTNTSLGSARNRPAGADGAITYYANPYKLSRISTRASTNSNPGMAHMIVSRRLIAS